MKPSAGRIVHYTLDADDAEQVNRRREDGLRYSVGANTGYQLHVGNPAEAGQVFPMIAVAVSDPGDGHVLAVNGQVFLDGNDVLWVRSATEGTEHGQWHWPERIS